MNVLPETLKESSGDMMEEVSNVDEDSVKVDCSVKQQLSFEVEKMDLQDGKVLSQDKKERTSKKLLHKAELESDPSRLSVDDKAVKKVKTDKKDRQQAKVIGGTSVVVSNALDKNRVQDAEKEKVGEGAAPFKDNVGEGAAPSKDNVGEGAAPSIGLAPDATKEMVNEGAILSKEKAGDGAASSINSAAPEATKEKVNDGAASSTESVPIVKKEDVVDEVELSDGEDEFFDEEDEVVPRDQDVALKELAEAKRIAEEREKILAKRKATEFVKFVNSPEHSIARSVAMSVKAVVSKFDGVSPMYYLILTDNNYHLQTHLKGEVPVYDTGKFAMPMKYMYRQTLVEGLNTLSSEDKEVYAIPPLLKLKVGNAKTGYMLGFTDKLAVFDKALEQLKLLCGKEGTNKIPATATYNAGFVVNMRLEKIDISTYADVVSMDALARVLWRD